MKVVGRFKTVYEYDSSGKTKDADGVSYQVKNPSGCTVKMLDKIYCTKAKEQEINAAMTNKTSWHGQVVKDMIYSHGRFTGIVVESAASVPEGARVPGDSGFEGARVPGGPGLEPPRMPGGPGLTPPGMSGGPGLTPPGGSGMGGASGSSYDRRPEPPRNPRASGGNEILDNTAVKIVYAVLVGLAFSSLIYVALFDVYVNIVGSMFSQDIADSCYTFNFSGVTGMIGGIVGLAFSLKSTYEEGGIKYYVSQPLGYLFGMIAVFIVVTVLVLLLKTLYAIFIALVPVLLIVGAIIFVLKSTFGSSRR